MIAGTPAAGAPPRTRDRRPHLTLADGSEVRWSDDGSGTVTDKQGRVKAFPVPKSPGRSGLGAKLSPPESAIRARALAGQQPAYAVGAGAGSARTSLAQIQTMNTGPGAAAAVRCGRAKRTKSALAAIAGESGVPGNAGVSTSLQSYLNAQGVNAVGAFQDAATYLHALPGAGQIITNVSIGDLTDQSMADAGDDYVPSTARPRSSRTASATSTCRRCRSSRPTPPTTTAGWTRPAHRGPGPHARRGLLDFSMMAPLPHDQQRPEAPADGTTDLLGIAPGADYRLVVPEEPSYQGIAAALRAAADQKPRPNVITASLGFGTDANRVPRPLPGGRPDDPGHVDLHRQVRHRRVVSSNDGTRLALPVSVGPDGGSTPTDVTGKAAPQTDIDDVAPTTTPSRWSTAASSRPAAPPPTTR